jgi:hypothetical protein
MTREAKRQQQNVMNKQWREDSLRPLKAEFTEARILKLASTKPGKLNDLPQAVEILCAIKKLRSFLRDAPVDSYDAVKGRIIKQKKGWVYDLMYGGEKGDYLAYYYLTTTARIARFDLLIEDLHERIRQLEAEIRQEAEAMTRSQKARLQFAGVVEDKSLAGALWHAVESAPPTVGFVYLKRWAMHDGSCWFKVGITNNPDRRETEQNVLPVAAETIACVDVGSMDRARAIEASIHKVLEEQRITNANNRELFHLSAQQASAVKAVLEMLE